MAKKPKAVPDRPVTFVEPGYAENLLCAIEAARLTGVQPRPPWRRLKVPWENLAPLVCQLCEEIEANDPADVWAGTREIFDGINTVIRGAGCKTDLFSFTSSTKSGVRLLHERLWNPDGTIGFDRHRRGRIRGKEAKNAKHRILRVLRRWVRFIENEPEVPPGNDIHAIQGNRRECYVRDHRWLKEYDDGKGMAKIRDDWNTAHPNDVVEWETVKKGIGKAKKERQATGES